MLVSFVPTCKALWARATFARIILLCTACEVFKAAKYFGTLSALCKIHGRARALYAGATFARIITLCTTLYGLVWPCRIFLHFLMTQLREHLRTYITQIAYSPAIVQNARHELRVVASSYESRLSRTSVKQASFMNFTGFFLLPDIRAVSMLQ